MLEHPVTHAGPVTSPTAPLSTESLCTNLSCAGVSREHLNQSLTLPDCIPAEGVVKFPLHGQQPSTDLNQPVVCESAEQLMCIHAHISQVQTILFPLQHISLTLKCPFPVTKICLGCLRHIPKFYEVSWFFDPLNEAWKGMAMGPHP